MAEIDRSKKTFSYFTKPEYSRFDAIVHNVAHITPAFIKETLEKRLELMAKQGVAVWGDALQKGVSTEDLVFRVMTNEHIPVDPLRKRRIKVLSDEGRAKTPFPPYKHYIVVNGSPIEVGRSHWKGDLETGYFSLEHGKMTNRLATMFMLLVERYSKRGNWRGYCVDETTEALTQRGWLNMHEINENDIILSYNMEDDKLTWSKIKSIFRSDYDGKMFKLDVAGMDALVTPGHKFVTTKGLKPVEFLIEKDRLILMGNPVEAPKIARYSDTVVSNVADGYNWPITEFMEFILALTSGQKENLISKMAVNKQDYVTNNKDQLDGFLALCTLAGYPTITKVTDLGYQVSISKKYYPRFRIVDLHGGKIRGKTYPGHGKFYHQNEPTVEYQGKVWCPETEYGTFIAKRNGTVYANGNTYNDEMRSHALLQLSQIGLQFDESKSDNPFAFYTQVIKNCLAGDTKILTKEYGAIEIEKVSEQDVTLLDGNGDWVKCHIYDHGIQETVPINFYGRFGKETIRSTMEHGWIEDGTGRVVYTKEFVANNGYTTKNVHIANWVPSKVVKDEASYRRGIVHGMVYGDGTHSYNSKKTCYNYNMRVCSKHDCIEKWLTEYPKTYQASANGDPTYFFHDVWCDFKKFPVNPGEDTDYLLGFLRGWFSADGCVSTQPNPSLCGDQAEFDWLAQWGPVVGWHVRNASKLAEETNFGVRKKKSLNFYFQKGSMFPEDFLLEIHRSRWMLRPARKTTWRVYPATEYKKPGRPSFGKKRQNFDDIRQEKVYCPIVETTHSFASYAGIATQNCFTRILNVERKNQHIRDDLLIIAGVQPSYTRQIDHEIEQRFGDEGNINIPPNDQPKVVELPKKRGRKPKNIAKDTSDTDV